jgi:hypothetical protein
MNATKTLNPNEIRKIRRNHERVQALGQHAERAAKAGDKTGALRRGREAFKLARRNADLVRGTSMEPMRSGLHLVAAAFALDIQRYEQVIEMANRGLSGNGPEEVTQGLQHLRQAAMQAKLQSSGEGVSDTDGTGQGKRLKETAQGDNESRPESGHEPGDSAAREPQSEHGEQVRQSDLHG